MAGWVRGVACPTCFRALYTLECEDGQTEWKHKGTTLQRDALGHFVLCTECRTRVPHRVAADVPGFGFEVAR